MRHFRAFILVSMALGATGSLMAELIPDPIIKFTIPGGHSVDLCTPALGSDTCQTTVPEAIGSDGFGTIDLHNPATNFAATEMDFSFFTDNLDQAFTASSTDFGMVTIERLFSCDGTCSNGGTLEVNYFGVGGDFTTPGSAFLAALPCEGADCSIVGFVPFSSVIVNTTFAGVTDPPDSCCDGLQPDEHGEVSLSADTPEPGSLVLLLGAAGLLGLNRRFWHR